MQHFLQKAAWLNNNAALRLSCGKTEKVVDALHYALQIIKDNLSQRDDCFSLYPNQPSLQDLVIDASFDVPNMEHDTFFMYSHPIQFSPAKQGCCIDQSEIAFCKAIIYFNIALAHHVELMVSGEIASLSFGGEKKTLQISLEYYRRCLEILDELCIWEHQPQQLMVAALNNQAQIYYQLCNYNEARNNIEIIHAICVGLLNIEDDDIIAGKTELMKIVMNAAVIQQPFAAGCA